MRKVRRYTEPILVRFDKRIKLDLEETASRLEMNEAVYCRRAVELCLKRGLINGKGRA